MTNAKMVQTTPHILWDYRGMVLVHMQNLEFLKKLQGNITKQVEGLVSAQKILLQPLVQNIRQQFEEALLKNIQFPEIDILNCKLIKKESEEDIDRILKKMGAAGILNAEWFTLSHFQLDDNGQSIKTVYNIGIDVSRKGDHSTKNKDIKYDSIQNKEIVLQVALAALHKTWCVDILGEILMTNTYDISNYSDDKNGQNEQWCVYNMRGTIKIPLNKKHIEK